MPPDVHRVVREVETVKGIATTCFVSFLLLLCAPGLAGADPCEPGKVSLLGHCCWPGQDWGLTTQRCIGTPQCPEWTVASGDDCVPLFEPSSTPAHVGVVRADCSTTASQLPGEYGDRYLVTCPDGCGTGTVWGTNVYTDDSSICSAAIHNGTVTAEGGAISLILLPGRDAYLSTTRHTILSATWGTWGRSFSVTHTGAEEGLIRSPDDDGASAPLWRRNPPAPVRHPVSWYRG